MTKPKFIDKVANFLGYVKEIALTTSAAIGGIEYPAPRAMNYLAQYKSWVYACVNARARDVSRIELNLFRVKNRKSGEIEEVADHNVLSVLKSVNDFMTFRELIHSTQSYKDLAGEAFWWIIKAKNGEVLQIWPLRPDYVKVLTDEKEFIKGYVYEVPAADPVNFAIDEIIHFKTFNPINPYRGFSVIQAAATTIDTDTHAEQYNKQFFKNSAIPAIVLSTEQKLQPSQVNRMAADWKREYGGTNKAAKMAILEGGVDIKPFSISQKEMEFLKGQGFTRDKVFALFNTPKTVLGMTDNVTVSNAKATDLIFSKRVVKPLMEDLRDTLNEFLIPMLKKGGEDLFFGITDPVPEDVEAKTKESETLFKIGAITGNEVRQKFGFDEVDGLDRFYVPINIMPVGSTVEEGEEEEEKIITHRIDKRPKVKMPAKTVKQDILEKVSEEIKGKVGAVISKHLSTITTGKKNPSESFGASTIPEETKNAFWKQLVQLSEAFEKKYRDTLIKFLNDQKKGVLERLDKVDGKGVTKINNSDIDKILFSLTTEDKIAIELLSPFMKEFFEEGGQKALELLNIDELGFDVTTASARQFLNKDSLKGIKSMNRTTKKALRGVLSEAVREGLSPQQTAKRITTLYDQIDKVRALKISRTEILKAGNRGTLEGYGQSGVVVAKEWFTSLDERVCEWCAPLQGKVVGVESAYFNEGDQLIGKEGGVLKFNLEEVLAPPLHPNCRCTLIPVTGSTRSAKPKKEIKRDEDMSVMKSEIKEELKDEMKGEMKKEIVEEVSENVIKEIKEE